MGPEDGHRIDDDELADEVWEDESPAAARIDEEAEADQAEPVGG